MEDKELIIKLQSRLEKAKKVYYEQKKHIEELEEVINEYDNQLVWEKSEKEKYQKQLKISNMKLQQIRQIANI